MTQRDISCLIATFVMGSAVTGFFYIAGFFLDVIVVPPAGIIFDKWAQEYQEWTLVIGGTCLFSSLAWFLVAKFMLKVNGPRDTGRRMIWLLGLVLPAAAFVAVLFMQTPVSEGQMVVITLFFLQAMLGYYLPTVLFSPSSYKYAPIGATVVRKMW